jgi:putative colanic acid biosynthesis acetyltransferase WcaF
MGDQSALSESVDCYCADKVWIESHTTVSQYSFLCTASHDIRDPHMELTTAPITIKSYAWVCAGAFISPGVEIGEGGVVAARAVVVKNVDPWTVVGGNPAKFIKRRILRESK